MLTLREGAISDAEEIAALFTAARNTAMPYLPCLHTQEQVIWWIENIVLEQSIVTVACISSRIAGFSCVQAERLDHLYVSPDDQGCGVGSALLDAARKDKMRLRLHVFQRNARARSFYEKHDFRLMLIRDGSQNEEREPDAVYEWCR